MNNQKITLTAMDFLIMAQNGTLKVMLDDKGTVTGINISDELINQYDGMLVALDSCSELFVKTSYTLIRKSPEQSPIEMLPVENLEEDSEM